MLALNSEKPTAAPVCCGVLLRRLVRRVHSISAAPAQLHDHFFDLRAARAGEARVAADEDKAALFKDPDRGRVVRGGRWGGVEL